jgi:hypothetical protein
MCFIAPRCRVAASWSPSTRKRAIGRVGDGLGEVAVVAAALVHEVDIVAGIAAVAQPAALLDVEAGGVVQAGIGLALPADVVEELGGDVAARAQVALVGAEHAPAVVVDLVQLLVRGFEQRDIALVPRGVIAEPGRGDGVASSLGEAARVGGAARAVVAHSARARLAPRLDLAIASSPSHHFV